MTTCQHVFEHYRDWDTEPDGSPVIDEFYGDDDTPGYSHCTLDEGHVGYHQDADGNQWNADTYRWEVQGRVHWPEDTL